MNDLQDLTLVGLAASQISFVKRPQLYARSSTQPALLPRLTLVILCSEVANSSSVQVCTLGFKCDVEIYAAVSVLAGI